MEMMSKFVHMPLQNTIDGAHWKRVNQISGFPLPTILLLAVHIPFPIDVGSVAVVAQMTNHQDCVRTAFPQFFALLYHDVLVLQELVGWKFAIFEAVCCARCVDSRQANHPYPDSAREFVNLGQFLLWQEFRLALLRANVGSKVSAFLSTHIG